LQTSKKRMPMDQNEFNALVSTLPDHVLLEIGKRTCSTDFAVRFYNDKNHKKFYKNRSELERAIRRMYTIGAFNHREIAVQIIQKHLPNTSQS